MTPTRLVIALVPAAAVAAGNYAAVRQFGEVVACGPCMAWLVGAPVVLAVLLALIPSRTAPVIEEVTPAAPPEPPENAALHLLSLLQEEGRFVDFLQEDLAPYPDEQIGAAVRGIHEGCRKALGDRIAFEPVLGGAEGETVTVEAGFDPAAVRLTGNVHGTPPFGASLRHAGWRATQASLPARRGQDPHVIAPAEVEIA
jgi:hypothetical protein